MLQGKSRGRVNACRSTMPLNANWCIESLWKTEAQSSWESICNNNVMIAAATLSVFSLRLTLHEHFQVT
jgi:hypothetical protein